MSPLLLRKFLMILLQTWILHHYLLRPSFHQVQKHSFSLLAHVLDDLLLQVGLLWEELQFSFVQFEQNHLFPCP
ncbi:hypothetical protein BD560DRAFT_385290 [Blakeslea trispora]|nr:hypothetical protein BD560DRAFT_385290 [Blakeslea trispora]